MQREQPQSRIRSAIGIIEAGSIVAGMQAADAMLKAADVELLIARPVCAGKHLTLVGGDPASVGTAIAVGEEAAGFALIHSAAITNLHPTIFPALAGAILPERLESLGVIEAFSVTALLAGADAAVKAAPVELLEIRLAMTLGGKAFCTFTGPVAAVRAAVDVGAALISEQGLLVNQGVLANPSKELLREWV